MITTKRDGDKLTVEIEHECGSCTGSGLYSGMAEKDGCAVVCTSCHGTGRCVSKMTFMKFNGRRDKKGIKRVFQSACGYGISADDVTRQEDGKVIKFSKAGCTYSEWKAGGIPKPIEDLHCPYLHSGQRMQSSSHKAHALYESNCRQNMSFSWITDCKMYPCKEKCWKKYHELVGENFDETVS